MYLSNIEIVLNAVEKNPATQVIHLDGTDYVIYQKKLDASSRAKLKDSLESFNRCTWSYNNNRSV